MVSGSSNCRNYLEDMSQVLRPPSSDAQLGRMGPNMAASETQAVCVLPDSFVAPRSFNQIAVHGAVLVKTSSAPAIYGELYFYVNIPGDIEQYFPRYLGYEMVDCAPKPAISIAMALIHGDTLSQLFVFGGLTTQKFEQFLNSVICVHSSVGLTTEDKREERIYENYARKVESRFTNFQGLYADLGLDRESHFDDMVVLLRSYEDNRRGKPVNVVHGDAVFSNVLFETPTGRVVFVDMRGAQGDSPVLYGDAAYDLGKILQSLCGYDHILHAVPLGPAQLAEIGKKMTVFEEFVSSTYPGVEFADLVLITSSLLTTAIPLHEDKHAQMRFSGLAKALLELVREKGCVGAVDTMECLSFALWDMEEL